MNESDNNEPLPAVEPGALAILNSSEIDMQIATARKYPRSIVKFRSEALAMVTLNEQVAQECIYSLPRREKNKETGQWEVKPIEGPSARFAEVIMSAWGNIRAGARVVSDVGDFVTAQGVFHDLERNTALTYEVPRRITDSKGVRYKADMIGVTSNAACSIALRNAVLKGVPKAFWSDIYDAARQAAIGNVQTLVARRGRALEVLQKMGVQRDTVFKFLRVAGPEDITLEQLGTLFGITQALREGDTTPEQAFAVQDGDPAPVQQQRKEEPAAGWTDEAFAAKVPNWKNLLAKKGVAGIISMAETKGPLSDAQKRTIQSWAADPKTGEVATGEVVDVTAKLVPEATMGFIEEDVAKKMKAAATLEQLAEAGSLISSIQDKAARKRLNDLYDERSEALN